MLSNLNPVCPAPRIKTSSAPSLPKSGRNVYCHGHDKLSRSWIHAPLRPIREHVEKRLIWKVVNPSILTLEIASPPKFQSMKSGSITTAIAKSRYILELPTNFDGEGSKKYEKGTWNRAIKFLTKYNQWSLAKIGFQIPAPNICHGPDGSIDILWENSKFRLAINIPEDKKQLVEFFGDNYKDTKIEGTLKSISINFGLIEWLMKLK